MKRSFAVILSAALFAWGCGSESTTPVAQSSPGTGTSFRQIEQLARPGINEALLFTNAFLNTYNAVSPAFIAAALNNPNGPEGQAAAPVLTQATQVLDILTNLAAGGPTTGQIVAAFLPDVMRCNADLNVPVASTAYAFALNGTGSPVAGRKLTDDVIDITYSVIVGAGTTDNVPYYPPQNNTNPAIGHQNLNGQAAPNGTATFPFLAPAN